MFAVLLLHSFFSPTNRSNKKRIFTNVCTKRYLQSDILQRKEEKNVEWGTRAFAPKNDNISFLESLALLCETSRESVFCFSEASAHGGR